MACYKFYQDKKYTVWERTFFTVEADSEEAAIRCAGQLGKGDLYAAEMQQEGIVSIRFTTYFLEVFENIWDKIWRN